MINLFEVAETNKMIEQENLDVRTITLGISLDCMIMILMFYVKIFIKKLYLLQLNPVSTEQMKMKYGILLKQ